MSVLKIHLTYQCTASCEHCRFRCTSRSAPVIDKDLAIEVVNTLKSENDLNLVVILGGEPGLFPNLTHWLAKTIRALDINVRVESNASWATSDTAARQFLARLYADDVSVMFSLDAYHAPFTPLERVERAIRVSEELDGVYNLEIAYLDLAERSHLLDKKTDALYAELSSRLGFKPQSYQGNIFFNGRSTERLVDLVAQDRGVPDEPCHAVLDELEHTPRVGGRDDGLSREERFEGREPVVLVVRSENDAEAVRVEADDVFVRHEAEELDSVFEIELVDQLRERLLVRPPPGNEQARSRAGSCERLDRLRHHNFRRGVGRGAELAFQANFLDRAVPSRGHLGCGGTFDRRKTVCCAGPACGHRRRRRSPPLCLS